MAVEFKVEEVTAIEEGDAVTEARDMLECSQEEYVRVRNFLLVPLNQAYGPREEPGFYSQLINYTCKFSEAQLKSAVDRLIRTQRYYPRISEVLRALDGKEIQADRSGSTVRSLPAPVAQSNGQTWQKKLEAATYSVERWVHGFDRDLSRWGPDFARLTLVQRAEAEGWGRDLRAHVRAQAMRLKLADLPECDAAELMPQSQAWIDYHSHKAAIERAANAAWELANPNRQAPKTLNIVPENWV